MIQSGKDCVDRARYLLSVLGSSKAGRSNLTIGQVQAGAAEALALLQLVKYLPYDSSNVVREDPE